MGNACSCICGSKKKSKHNLLDDAHFPDGGSVMLISLHNCKKLASHDMDGLADPYVVVKLVPDQADLGCQSFTSTCKANTLTPVWEPEEKFQFVISDIRTARLVLSVFDKDLVGSHENMGDAMIRLTDYGSNCGKTKLVLSLVGADGHHIESASEIEISLEMMSRDRALSFRECLVYEYQRWRPESGWGSEVGVHLLPGIDPGKWSNFDCNKYSQGFDEIISPDDEAKVNEQGWMVHIPWSYVSRAGLGGDPEGWQYSAGFKGFDWYDTSQRSSTVRRRVWKREIFNPNV